LSWSQQRWEILWAAAKDIALTGTGVILIISQVFASSPSDILLATGLALTVPSVASHARVLLSGNSGQAGRSSPPSPPSGSSASGSSSPEAAGE
jgi:hypothetical protein